MRNGDGLVEDARGVVERLRARRVELVQAIFARVRAGVFGGVGVEDAEYVAGLRTAVAAAVEYGLQGIERGEEWAGPIPVAVLEQARRAARAGVSLDMVLRRYVLGHTLLGEFVMEEVARGARDRVAPAERGALRGLLRAQAVVLDRLLEAITGEYGNELIRVGLLPEQRRMERVRRLLDGCAPEGSQLGYELEGWHVAVIARGSTGLREALCALAAGLDRRLLCVEYGEATFWAWLGGQRRLEMSALERAMADDFPTGVSLVVGEPACGLAGWRLTHQQAQAALVVALRRPRRFTRYADVVLLAAALRDEALGRALIEIYLAPMEDPRGGGSVLRETLRAYLATERSVSSAAAALGVARKTVASRLRTIEERLGRSLHPCPAELEVALLLEELVPTPVPLGISNF
jgi:hypothetical protein